MTDSRSNSRLEKALIINIDDNNAQIKCLFNPNAYTYTKQNSWSPGGGSGQDTPSLDFSKGNPATLQMELFFDTHPERGDVRKHTDAVWNLMLVDPKLKNPGTEKSRPPRVRFQWGQSWSFEAVIESITQKFTLFLGDGTPVRATLDVMFKQCSDPNKKESQNPTSGGQGGERLWTVSAGDTLAWIAFKEYGDSTQWRRIADHNRLTNLRRLTPGMVLEIPNA